MRRRIKNFLNPPSRPESSSDDPIMRSQYAEVVALAQWSQLAEEQQREHEILRRVCVQGQICAQLANGMTRTDAAIAVGVARSTMYRWLEEDLGFRRAVAEAELAGSPFRITGRNRKPRKLGEPAREAILRLLRAGGTRAQAAQAAGVSRQTFYSWFKRFPDFRDAVLVAEREGGYGRHGPS